MDKDIIVPVFAGVIGDGHITEERYDWVLPAPSKWNMDFPLWNMLREQQEREHMNGRRQEAP